MLAISYHNGGYGSAITELTKSAAQAAADAKWMHMQHDKDRPPTKSFGGFGAITEDQLLAFEQAMRGCSSGEGAAQATTVIQGMLQAFPDPVDRAAIRQRLTTTSSTSPGCVQAVNNAFNVADVNTPSTSSSIFKSPTFWGVGAGVVGLALGVFIGRSVGKR